VALLIRQHRVVFQPQCDLNHKVLQAELNWTESYNRSNGHSTLYKAGEGLVATALPSRRCGEQGPQAQRTRATTALILCDIGTCEIMRRGTSECRTCVRTNPTREQYCTIMGCMPDKPTMSVQDDIVACGCERW
jgi:hypothetical protein